MPAEYSLCLTDGPFLWLVRPYGTRCLTVLRNHDISKDNLKRLFKTHLKHPAHQSLFYDDMGFINQHFTHITIQAYFYFNSE